MEEIKMEAYKRYIDAHQGYNILIYNDEQLYYIEGNLMGIECESAIPGQMRADNQTFTFNNCHTHESIKLDDTMMRRILKYNKEKEFDELNEKIEKKKEEIKQLESIIDDRKERCQKVDEYIANIYNLNLNEENNDDDDDDNFYGYY